MLRIVLQSGSLGEPSVEDAEDLAAFDERAQEPDLCCQDVLEDLKLWGMTDNLSLWDDPNRGLDLVGLLPSADESRETDVYTLAMTFKDERVNGLHLGNAGYRLAARDDSGRWVNAVERNIGGRKRFIRGPWNSAYGLGTFGVDTATQTAWAVINHEGDFAVVRDLEG